MVYGYEVVVIVGKVSPHRPKQMGDQIADQLNNRRPGIDYGWLEVVTGNMFSGKSEHLILSYFELIQTENFYVRLAQREGLVFRARKVQAYKHSADMRYSDQAEIITHSGMRIPCKAISKVADLVSDVIKEDVHVIIVDEVQFFREKNEENQYLIVEAALKLLDEKRYLILALLDKDFRGMPFGPVGDLLAIADAKPYYISTCAVCGAPATLPQRLIDGRPAKRNDSVMLVGSSDYYEPRCRSCHEIGIDE